MPENLPSLPYALRVATAADYEFLYRLHVACMQEYVAATWGWNDAVQQVMFKERFAPERSQIVSVRGEAVGVISVERRATDWFIASIEIAPTMQGQGLGASLIRQVLAQAAIDRLPARLQVLHTNPARRLYERLGFTVEGTTPTHLLMVALSQVPAGKEGWRDAAANDA